MDGETHVGRKEQDDRRTNALNSHGVTVIRFTNDDVMRDLDAVAQAIQLTAKRLRGGGG